jgi:hypothetical protein
MLNVIKQLQHFVQYDVLWSTVLSWSQTNDLSPFWHIQHSFQIFNLLKVERHICSKNHIYNQVSEFSTKTKIILSAVDHGIICGVMVSVLALSAVDHGIEPGWVKQKTIKLVFVTLSW